MCDYPVEIDRLWPDRPVWDDLRARPMSDEPTCDTCGDPLALDGVCEACVNYWDEDEDDDEGGEA